MKTFNEAMQAFPDDVSTLRRERLVYFTYSIAHAVPKLSSEADVDSLVEAGNLIFKPVTYEDFLPASAAGIFYSNLGGRSGGKCEAASDQAVFERSLGCSVHNEFKIYQQIEEDSISECLKLFRS
jgi:uncharacterized glyoxalase superfamily metalloenzyme YdcJ